jgi:predicted ATP-dependent Lon-type protease
MRIKYKESSWHKDYEEVELHTVIETQLNNLCYNSGEIETLRDHIGNLQGTVLGLLEVLYSNKKITSKQLCIILKLDKQSIRRIKSCGDAVPVVP